MEKDSVKCKKITSQVRWQFFDVSHLFLLKTGIMGHEKRGAEAAQHTGSQMKSPKNLEKACDERASTRKIFRCRKGLSELNDCQNFRAALKENRFVTRVRHEMRCRLCQRIKVKL